MIIRAVPFNHSAKCFRKQVHNLISDKFGKLLAERGESPVSGIMQQNNNHFEELVKHLALKVGSSYLHVDLKIYANSG